MKNQHPVDGLAHEDDPRSAFDIRAVSAEWAHVGWYFTDPDNLHRYNGYDVMNLELATPARNGFAVVGRLANVANKRYSVATSFNPFVPADQQDRYTPGLLRTLYLGLQYKQLR